MKQTAGSLKLGGRKGAPRETGIPAMPESPVEDLPTDVLVENE
jgi:hypothetical protein